MYARTATTQWSQVLAARDGSDTEARAALESLCRTYWQPLYAYIRHRGHDPEEARDLTQAYFAELLEKDFLAHVDPEKGRFRSFLLASLRNFLSHERDRARALKRGGRITTLSLDVAAGERGYRIEPAEELTPEDAFERRWAMTVLERAIVRLRAESTEFAGESLSQLKRYLISGEPRAPYRETAATLGISESALKSTVHRLRKRLGRCLREEIGETVSGPDQIDEEIRHLLAVVKP